MEIIADSIFNESLTRARAVVATNLVDKKHGSRVPKMVHMIRDLSYIYAKTNELLVTVRVFKLRPPFAGVKGGQNS